LTKASKGELLRNLDLKAAIGIVIGSMIGTGVFLKTAVMTQQVGSPTLVLAAWAVAGALSLFGALVYAELGALFPHSGGEYVFMREGYNSLGAFLYGWLRFWIVTPASIAAFAVGTAKFSEALTGLPELRTYLAIAFIAAFSIVNCFSVSFAGAVQAYMTALKVVMIGGLTGGLLIFGGGSSDSIVPAIAQWGGFGAAVLSALWAFDGWNNLPMAAGEVRNPEKILPKALAWGTFIVFGIYALTNIGYFWVLPLDQITTASSSAYPDALPVATRAAQMIMGENAVKILSVMFMCSALGAMNGSMLTGARVPFAMARDGLFFSGLGKISESTSVPAISVFVQGLLATVMALLGTFDQLTDYVVFASWIFYALIAGALIRLRRREPNRERHFRCPGYPWLPLIFIGSTILLLVNTLINSPKESGIGLLFILAGIPAYYWFRRLQLLGR
jgi:APA family basic amino acid/polyamine antiporter